MSTEVQNVNPVSDQLDQQLRALFDKQKLTPANIIAILPNLMKTVEHFRQLNGLQRKAAVLQSLERYIDEVMADSDDGLKNLVQMTLPVVIDMFVSIDRRKLTIKLKKTWLSCLKRF